MSFFLKLDVESLSALAGRMNRLLCTGVDADVHFLVGQEGGEQELLHAHKLILRFASDVFEAMFRFDEAKQKEKNDSSEVSNTGHVLIPDVDIEAFKTMLDFIYTGNLSGVNAKNAIDVLYAAKKYNLPLLAKACGGITLSELDNVFIALVEARLLEEKDFAGLCLAYIDRNADTLIQSKEFLQIDQQLLCELLDRDQLAVNGEIAIWNAAIRWADEQCGQKDLDFSPENRRQMLGSALYHIRFPIIQKDFMKDIVSSGLLTKDELNAVLLYHSTSKPSNSDAVCVPYPLPFLIRQRSAGKLTLKIEKFSEFVQAKEMSRKYSEAVYIGGFEWQIFANIKTLFDIKYLGFFIQCSAENNGSDWSCSYPTTLHIVSQKQGKPDYALTLNKTLSSKTPSWGHRQFKSIMDLMDPNNGWYMEKEDTVIFSAVVTVRKNEEKMEENC